MEKSTGSHAYETLTNNRIPRTLLWAVVVAFAVRLVVIGFVYQGFLVPWRDHWEFAYETGKIARSILMGQGFSNPYWVETGPTAEVAPVLPYLVAGVMAIFGIYTKAAAVAVLTLNSLVSAFTCVPIFFLAKKSFGLREARWAAWIWVFFPYAVHFSADSMWDHALTAFFLTLLLLIALHLQSSTRLRAWAGFGFLWGLSALTSPVILGTLPFLAGWVCWRLQRQKRNWTIPAATAALVLLLVLAPWMIRNYRTFHRPVFLKDTLPMVFLDGNYGNKLHWWDGARDPCGNPAELAEFQALGEQAFMAEKWREAFDVLRGNPGTFVWRSVRRVVYMWTGYWSFSPEYLREEPFDPLNIVLCTTFTFLAIIGLSKAFRKAPDVAAPYALVLLVYPLVYYITHSDMAYRHPLDPEIVILASYAVVAWLPQRQPAVHGE